MGLMGQDLLAGRLPLFFYGQAYMGGLDTLLTAPLLALFGPASWILNLWPPLFGLGTMALTHRLMTRVLSPVGVLCGLLLLAIPPANWLFLTGYAQNHFSLGMLFCAWLLLLSAQLEERASWGLGRPFLWGLAAGLAVYTLPQSGVVLLPCGLFLLATRPRQALGWPLAAALPGLLLGAAPLLYLNWLHGWMHLQQAQSFALAYLGRHFGPLLTNALPIVLGFNTPAVAPDLAGPSPLIWFYPPVLALNLAGLAGLAWRGRRPGMRAAWLAPAVVAVNLLVLLGTLYGRALEGFHQAYLMPLYLVLPLAWGQVGQWAAARRGYWAGGMVLGLAALHLAAYPGFTLHGNRLLAHPGATLRNDAQFRQGVARLRAAGFHQVYASPSYVWSFFGQGDPVFSDPWEERSATRACLVDAALDPAFWVNLRSSLEWLGLAHEQRQMAGATLYHGFAPPAGVERLLPRAAWRAVSLEGQDLGRALSDGDLASGFNTVEPARAGQGFVLDLGREQEVAGLALVPAEFGEIPGGISLEWAGADGRFQPLARAEGYWGPLYLSGPHPVLKARHPRVECYFSPRRARFLRLTHLGQAGHPWSVQEVLAWGPAGPGAKDDSPPTWRESGQRLLDLLAAEPPRGVLADTWPAALIQTAFGGTMATTPGNTTWDDFGFSESPPEAPLPLRPAPGQALVAQAREAGAVAASLERLGAPFSRQQAGRLTLFRLTGGLAGRELKVAAVTSPVDPQAALGLATGGLAPRRWASQAPQSPGVWLLLDLGQPQTLAWLDLDSPRHPQDFPRGLRAEVSDDGERFRATDLELAGPLCFSGQVLLAAPQGGRRYHLPARPQARYLRLVLDGAHPERWWSIQRLRVWAP